MHKRYFELTLSYKSDIGNWETQSHDVLMADDLVSLLTQFNVLIAQLHRRIVNEEVSEHGGIKDDDIPF